MKLLKPPTFIVSECVWKSPYAFFSVKTSGYDLFEPLDCDGHVVTSARAVVMMVNGATPHVLHNKSNDLFLTEIHIDRPIASGKAAGEMAGV